MEWAARALGQHLLPGYIAPPPAGPAPGRTARLIQHSPRPASGACIAHAELPVRRTEQTKWVVFGVAASMAVFAGSRLVGLLLTPAVRQSQVGANLIGGSGCFRRSGA